MGRQKGSIKTVSAKLKGPKQDIWEDLSQTLSGGPEELGYTLPLFLIFSWVNSNQPFMPTTPRQTLDNVSDDLHNQKSLSGVILFAVSAVI